MLYINKEIGYMENMLTKKNQKVWNIFFLLIILLPTLFVYKFVYNFRINQATIISLLAIGIFTFYIFSIIKEGKIKYSRNSLNLPILLFVLFATISILLNNSLLIGQRDFTIFLLYFFVINNIKTTDSFNFCLIIFFISASLISLYLLLQYYGYDPFLYDIEHLSSTLLNRNYFATYLALLFPISINYFNLFYL